MQQYYEHPSDYFDDLTLDNFLDWVEKQDPEKRIEWTCGWRGSVIDLFVDSMDIPKDFRDECRDYLAEEWRADPAIETRIVYQAINHDIPNTYGELYAIIRATQFINDEA